MTEVHCDECGRSWDEKAAFCGACGGRLDRPRLHPSVQTRRFTGAGDRGRWLVVGIVLVVVVAGAGTTALTGPSTSDDAAGGDDDVVVPGRDELQDPDGRQEERGPSVTCERRGEKTGCVSWVRRLASASPAPDLHSWRIEITDERILARDAETIVALSRDSGQVAWRKDFDPTEGPPGGPWVVSGAVAAVQMGEAVRALSLIDGSELWTVDDTRTVLLRQHAESGTIYTARLEGGRSVLTAHEADGTVRWRHRVMERASTGPPPRPGEVTEAGSTALVISRDSAHGLSTIALDRDDGSRRWQRRDSRPLRVSEGVAVMMDVDRDVDEQQDGSVTISESPAAVVGLDVTDGTERWRTEAAGRHQEYGIVGGVLVTRGTGDLTGLDLATGERRWQRDVAADERLVDPTTPYGPSASQHARLFSFVPREQRVLARDPGTGEIVWQTQLDDQLIGRVSTVQGAVVARRNQATVVQLDPTTGSVRGTMTTESDGRPRLISHDVVVDRRDGWVARIDLPDT